MGSFCLLLGFRRLFITLLIRHQSPSSDLESQTHGPHAFARTPSKCINAKRSQLVGMGYNMNMRGVVPLGFPRELLLAHHSPYSSLLSVLAFNSVTRLAAAQRCSAANSCKLSRVTGSLPDCKQCFICSSLLCSLPFPLLLSSADQSSASTL